MTALATMEWPWEAYPPWLLTARQERAMRRMSSGRTAAFTSKWMAWRERVFWKVSSRLHSSFTFRPPT